MFGLGGPELVIVAVIFLLILIPISCIIAITVVLSRYLSKKARYYQSTALIEKGINLSTLEKKPNEKQSSLKIGIFLVAVSIGLLTAYVITKFLPIPGAVIYFSMIFLFGGLSLILYYLISPK